MSGFPILAVLALLAFVSPALAVDSPAASEQSRSLARQLLVMWLPMAVVIGLWIFFIWSMGKSRLAKAQRAVIERTPAHMDALEQKLDRVIELLERQGSR